MINKRDITDQSKRRPKHSFFEFAVGKTRWKMVKPVRERDNQIFVTGKGFVYH